MSKRQNTSNAFAGATEERSKVAAVHTNGESNQPKRTLDKSRDMDVDGDADMGEFEDAYEDEIEEEDIVEREEDSDGIEMMDEEEEEEEDDEEVAEKKRQVYLPGDLLGEGETLQVDNSAYHMLHPMSTNWPCLSFDFVPDNMGNGRTMFPHTMYAFAGTQADSPSRNQVILMKMSQLHRTINDDLDAEDKNDEDVNDLDEDPILETRTIRNYGGVNRVRVLQSYQSPLAATWIDNGSVRIWDTKRLMDALETPGTQVPASATQPLFTIASHNNVEGYAMDWSTDGRLLTGDCDKKIFLTIRRNDTGASFVPGTKPFRGHESSVEDLQWSPEESSVFASCSADKSIKIWDVRAKNHGYALDVPNAHDSDVNVISWNRKSRYLLASGADNGDFKVWDMRKWTDASGRSTPAAQFNWHKGAITSIEWCPTDESVLAVAGSDDQLTLWDLAVELDAEEEARHRDAMVGPDGTKREVPAQLLFVHQGQSQIKELHWHPQIPGVIGSTSSTGFNFFKTISV
ncbi:WD40-repeat-containing domain protein [Kickxella alabastrina]|uniref:WD40-repeat-containing domain protein n=1 Tax=Kickxella alabastrina TaxID=61397 RepID=UPI00221EC7EE|nr:WD40-repeat-containing domain protein [Kickxella alabastrina]KAI7824540.1 WD40-repeat-containing domain protein [Kickxella alabastrina]